MTLQERSWEPEIHKPARRATASAPLHEAAVVEAEARRLVHILWSFGVLHRDALARMARAGNWHEGSFERALASAVASGQIEPLPAGFYRVGRARPHGCDGPRRAA